MPTVSGLGSFSVEMCEITKNVPIYKGPANQLKRILMHYEHPLHLILPFFSVLP
jgi:hypothetical protein